MKPVVTIGDTWHVLVTLPCPHPASENSQLFQFGTGRVANAKTLENCSRPNGFIQIRLSTWKDKPAVSTMTTCLCCINAAWLTLVLSFVDHLAMDVALEKQRFVIFTSILFDKLPKSHFQLTSTDPTAWNSLGDCKQDLYVS